MISLIPATTQHLPHYLPLAQALWPKSNQDELKKEFLKDLESNFYETYLAQHEDGTYIGFINLSLRTDYVQGSSTSPVAYIEGIYVTPEHRNQGIATQLVTQAETWAKEKNCTELASDTELHNTDSQAFHQQVGFQKSETIVHFIKKV